MTGASGREGVAKGGLDGTQPAARLTRAAGVRVGLVDCKVGERPEGLGPTEQSRTARAVVSRLRLVQRCCHSGITSAE